MRKVRIRILARVDRSTPRPAWVEINRDALLFTVRPLRARKSYTLPLSAAAEMVAHRVIRWEVAEARRQKAEARRAKRR